MKRILLLTLAKSEVRRQRSEVRGRRSRSEEHTSELQSRSDLVCRLLLEKKKNGRERRLPHPRAGGGGPAGRQLLVRQDAAARVPPAVAARDGDLAGPVSTPAAGAPDTTS